MKSVILTVEDPGHSPRFSAKLAVDDIVAFDDYRVTLKSGRVLNVIHKRAEIEEMLSQAE
ncbi:MAG TPA: hypothetical protein VJQ59_13680 [Candidatus Sulfotelmatobacter sp.]|nr:hypothetical protein [Candidatus Sulfotelmatobacter sp.]